MAMRVQGPNGAIVEFPDGTDNATIGKAMMQLSGGATPPPGADSKPQGAAAESWADVPAAAWNNLPSSALKTAQTMAYPLMHPADTVKSLYNIGYGGASKIAGYAGATQDPTTKAADESTIDGVGSMIKDRYGSAEGLKKTLSTDPVGAAADVATALMGGGAIVERAPGMIGKAGAAVKAAGVAVDPIANTGKLASALANTGGKAASNILGTSSGVGMMPVETAYATGKGPTGKAYRQNMRDEVPASDMTDMAQSARGQIIKDRSDAYKADRNELAQQNFRTWPRKVDGGPLMTALDDARNSVYHSGVARSDEAAKVLDQIESKVAEYGHATLKGKYTGETMDALKQSIGEIRLKTQPGSHERTIANDAYRAAKAEIVKQFPAYAEHMKDYADASNVIDEITRTFSLGEKAAKDTSLRKLTSVMRNNVNTNYGQRAKLMDVLAAKEPDLPAAIAGQAMNSWMPRGMASLPALGGGIAAALSHSPAMFLALPAASPRVVGEVAHAAGRVAGQVNRVTRHIPKKALLNALRGSYGAGDLSQ